MRLIVSLPLIVVIGLAGCRRASTSSVPEREAACAVGDCGKSTGPLTQAGAEREALKAVSMEVDSDHSCSIASVKERDRVYEVLVRIDPPPSGKKQLPEHWTVEIPKAGISQTPNAGGG